MRYYLPDFFQEVPDISLVFPDFSRGKNPANSRGKSGAITCTSVDMNDMRTETLGM